MHKTDIESPSFFENNNIKDLYKEVRNTYLYNEHPWVIGYSGGKDSTATTQVVWNALSELSSKDLSKPVYIISSDTFVEQPVVVKQMNKNLLEMAAAAKEQNLPFEVKLVYPEINDSFWVNLIGRGYPAPSQRFRWCTERLKIKPANRFIIEKAEEFGEVVMVLGARKSESMSRGQVMSKRDGLPGTDLYRHSSLTRAYVYTPIENFNVDDVWLYLDLYDSPWGGNNRDLAALYKRSSLDGECPLVIDTSTPSCGNSRFGCWTCTVVERDKSMEALINHGEEWMKPLFKYREKLVETQIPDNKLAFRRYKRRNGQVIVKEDGKFIPGPYKFEYRKLLLRELLETQMAIQKTGPDPELRLIQDEELHKIRRIWRIEESDWEDSVPIIFSNVTGTEMSWIADETGSFTSAEKEVIGRLCEEEDIPPQLVTRLIDMERRMLGMGRRSKIFSEIDRILSEEWRPKEEILNATKANIDQQKILGIK